MSPQDSQFENKRDEKKLRASRAKQREFCVKRREQRVIVKIYVNLWVILIDEIS